MRFQNFVKWLWLYVFREIQENLLSGILRKILYIFKKKPAFPLKNGQFDAEQSQMSTNATLSILFC